MRALLDGSGLKSKIGVTVLLVVNDEAAWPRVASLSVGELLVRGDEVLMTLWERSRTTAALRAARAGLLHVVDGGGIVRIGAGFDPIDVETGAGRVTFRGVVEEVELDVVPYAVVTHGISFELTDPDDAIARWEQQLDRLRQVPVR
ncbi:hypothetical protein [Pseudonocardia sp. MH-G8]|uniref:hypothetical protein n=1 Tax=Pseudonocardia sp. MH-G8 TaxID=1854588 RepID=UPI000BA14B92|nr:hypothetical protein [Pseudonocardia sp. MH-G8]OZM77065.1 hypothetical protein CFP66_37390 [Pseudonocardia sp. MH-G8]